MANYDVGDAVRITGAFTDVNSTAFDPDTITVKYKDPSGNTTTLVYLTDAALVKDSTGKYHVDINVDETGIWHYRFEGTASNSDKQGAGEAYFKVLRTDF